VAAQDQKIEYLFAAQVTGQGELQKLTMAVDGLRKEMDALKAASGGGGAGMQQFAKNVGNASSHVQAYQRHLDAQAKAMRNARQGTQQLGMQFNDLGTSISTGASPIQAFNQQLGQMGYALSMMEGRAGAVGAFLAGPWGAAIVLATMALVPLIESMMGASSAAKELEDAELKVRDSSIAVMFAKAELDEALGRNTDAYKKASAAALQAGLDDINSAKDALKASMARMTAAKQEAKALAILRGTGGATGSAVSFVAGLFGYGDVDAAKKGVLDDTAELNKVVEDQYKLLGKVGAKLKPSTPARVRTGSRAAASIQTPKVAQPKAKPEFSMLGFYEEFFAKEFQQNDESLAKVADGQIKELLETTAKVSPEMEAIQTRTEELNNSFESLGNSVSDAFKGMLTGAMSWKDGMRSLISSVIDQLWKLFVVQKIVGLVSGALGGATGTPTTGGFGSSVNLAGARAYGGSVDSNKPYMVGERGPELFIPGGNGTIIPNGNMRGAGGGGSNISVSVDARGSSDPAAVRAQVQQGILEAAPAIIAAAEARTVASMRRPRLGGVMQ
jgi:hypothetical protein